MAYIKRNIFSRIIPLFLAVLILLPLNPALGEEGLPKSLTIGIQSTKTLAIRPFEPLERDILSVYDLIYDSLVTIDDDYFPQACVASSWEYGSGGKSWTFHLRDDITFSDGTPLTSNDVVASGNYILDKARDENIADHGFYSNLNYFVKSFSAPDEHTVVVTAKSSKSDSRCYFGLLYQMTYGFFTDYRSEQPHRFPHKNRRDHHKQVIGVFRCFLFVRGEFHRIRNDRVRKVNMFPFPVQDFRFFRKRTPDPYFVSVQRKKPAQGCTPGARAGDGNLHCLFPFSVSVRSLPALYSRCSSLVEV